MGLGCTAVACLQSDLAVERWKATMVVGQMCTERKLGLSARNVPPIGCVIPPRNSPELPHVGSTALAWLPHPTQQLTEAHMNLPLMAAQ